jgi:glycosyltransferase involved in cell wall biosynthesis
MDELGEIVGGTRLNLTVLYGPRYLAPIRYIALLLRTLLVLFVKGPDIVYAQNPPVFCPLVCLLYTRTTRRKLLVDHHSIWSVKTIGRGPVSSVIGWLEGFVARSANANTAPHSRWGRKLTEMRGRGVVVIGDFVNRNPFTRDERLRKKYADTNVIAVASHGGHPLERIEVESGAVGSNPSVTLLICGPEEKLRARLSKGLPENARYLGFLPMEEYLRLKASADFALNITDEPYTLSHVLFEYAASSLPMVSSKQPVVEEVFGESIIYADSSNVREVSEKVKQFADDPGTMTEYKRRIMTKYEELERRRNDELGRLRRIVYDPTH